MDWFSFSLAFVAVILLRRFVRSFFPVFILPDNKAILITGCDTGFGHQLAVKAKKSGFFVFACCFSKSSEGAVALDQEGCYVLEVDVTQQSTIDAALVAVQDHLKKSKLSLHGVVNNAGVNVTSGPMEWSSVESVERVLNVNTMGVVRVTRSFLPLIRAAKGRIVNVCSMAAHVVGPRMIPYCMSKTATFVLSNGLRRELTCFGVKVATISPWFYSTNIVEATNLKRYAKISWDGASSEVQKAYAKDSTFEDYFKRTTTNKEIPYLRHDTSEVIDCMMDALTNVEPKADYIPDFKSRVFACLYEILPIKWVDYLTSKREKVGLGL